MTGATLRKPERTGYLGRTNKWGSLGRPADPTTLPLSDRVAPAAPNRALGETRAELSRSLRPHTASVLRPVAMSPMRIRPGTSGAARRSPASPSRSAMPEAAQRALIKACPPLAFTREPSKSLATIFKAWDKTGSGRLTYDELGLALKQLGVESDEKIQALARKVDASGSVRIYL